MKQFVPIILASLICFSSCKKGTGTLNIAGQWIWTIQYANNPAYNSTPQSTGIQETLSFGANGTYSLMQNNIIVNEGAYRTALTKSTNGDKVSSVLYSNSRVTDSVAYYLTSNNDDSLVFSYDLIGTVGSGSRHYGKQK